MITPFDELVVGQWYEVGMRYQGTDRLMEREMRARFMGESGYYALLFSLRPKAGTQAVPKHWVTRLEPTSDHTPMLPRKLAAS